MTHLAPDALQVTSWGAGEDVLLIHGSLTFGNPSEDDWPQQRLLADRYHLRMPARRGYGASPDRPPGYGFAEETDDLVQLLDANGSHLVGFSYGGVLALLMAARRPTAVRSLTVIEPLAYALARDNPHVAGLVRRTEAVVPPAPGTTPGAFLLGFRRALRDLPEGTSQELTRRIGRFSPRRLLCGGSWRRCKSAHHGKRTSRS